mmetsp:Transcript_35361/g.81986  ORF Transcript_35361/g.81986 Transcript_35361/m.81986 type:complete len:325 (-) Transcript_35361:124-1098(-)
MFYLESCPGSDTDSPSQTQTNSPTDSPTDLSTNLPTDSPSTLPSTPPSNLQTIFPSNLPTDLPSDYVTNSPTESLSEVFTDKLIYEHGELIKITFSYLKAKEKDFVGIYDNTDSDNRPDKSELFLRTCNSQSCKESVSSGVLVFGPNDPDEGNNQNWPLAAGVYRVYLMDKKINPIAYFDFSVITPACVDGSDKFVLKLKKGKATLKPCSWLTPQKIKKTCLKKVDYYAEGSITYKPAQVTCPVTCDTCDPCYENPKSKFYKSTKKGKVKTMTCSSLTKENDIEKYCGKTKSEFGFPPAKEVCPMTCSSCTPEGGSGKLKLLRD